MSLPPVFVTRRIPEAGMSALRDQVAPRVHDGPMPPTRGELLEGVRGCHGILSLLSERIDAEVFEAAGEQLRVVSNFAVGFNNIDLGEARRRGIAVGNTPDVLTDATADIAVALLLAVARHVVAASASIDTGGWRTWEPLGWIGRELAGRTVGIVGMGRIGAAVARRLHGGWGMRVLYTARSGKPEVERDCAARRVPLDTLLQESDFVSLHVPLSSETHALIGARELALMRPDALLINTARGEVIDQEALVQALRQQQIGGAGLDVCVPEPIPADHPLVTLDNCLLLPHIGSATRDARDNMARRAAENLLAGIRGRPLPYPVA